MIKKAIRGDAIRRAIGLLHQGKATPGMARRLAPLGLEADHGMASQVAHIAANEYSPHRSMVAGLLGKSKPLPQGPGVINLADTHPAPYKTLQPNGTSQIENRGMYDLTKMYRNPPPGGFGYHIMRQPMSTPAPKLSLMPPPGTGSMDLTKFRPAPMAKAAAQQALMGVSRMIPIASGARAIGGAASKMAPKAVRAGAPGKSLASMMRTTARAPVSKQPLTSSMAGPMGNHGARMPIAPAQPPGMLAPRPIAPAPIPGASATPGGMAAPRPPMINPSLTSAPKPPGGPQLARGGLQGLPSGFKGNFKSAFAKFAMFKAVTPLAKSILNSPGVRKGVGSLPLPSGLSHLGNLRQQTFGALPTHVQSAIANRHAIPELGGWSGGAGEMHAALSKHLGL